MVVFALIAVPVVSLASLGRGGDRLSVACYLTTPERRARCAVADYGCACADERLGAVRCRQGRYSGSPWRAAMAA
jgi:hypothetical protein